MEVSIEYNWNLSYIRRIFHFFPSYIQIKQRHNKYLPATLEGIKGKFCIGYYEVHPEIVRQYDYSSPLYTTNKLHIINDFSRAIYKHYEYDNKGEKNKYTILEKRVLLIDDKVALYKKQINAKGVITLYINEKFENNPVVKGIEKDYTNVLVYKQSDEFIGSGDFSFGRYVEDVKMVIQCNE